ITERKQTEKQLQESEERWQFALDGAQDGVWDWNTQTNNIFFSHRWKSMLGYNDDEIGDTLDEWDKLAHPDDKEQAYADIERHFSGKTPYYNNEHRLLCKDGSYKWILDRGKVISWTEDHKPLRVIGTHQDITDIKRTETAMKNIAIGVSAQTGELFFQQLVFQLAKVFDADYVFIGLINETDHGTIDTLSLCEHGEITRNLSYRLKDTPCANVLRQKICTYPEHVQKLFPKDQMLVEMGAESYIGTPMYNSEGTAIGLIVILDSKPARNIEHVTEILQISASRAAAEILRLKTLKDLKQSMIRLDQAQHQAHIGNWELDLLSNELHWSNEIYRIFEIDPDKFSATYEAFIDAIHPDDRDMVNAAYTKSLENKMPYSINHRLRMADGKIKYVLERCETSYDKQGKPIRSAGTVQDISEQVKIEE
ncbi:PAS domain-containing protein, partial [bacterium]|nr:PAS domain-containing protein [bacterium]